MFRNQITNLNEEKELLSLACSGHEKSFEKLFLFYYKPLGNYVYHMVEDYDFAEDIVQDVFLTLWCKKEKLKEIKSFKDYLFIVTKNKVITMLRQRVKWEVLNKSLDYSSKLNNIAEVDDSSSMNRELWINILEEEIEKLPAQQKNILKLSKINKMSYQQIADFLNISIETVRKHLYLAQRNLREQMRGKNHEIIIYIIFFDIF